MTTNNTTSPETLYNIALEGKARLYTAAEIRAAAADGLQIWLDVGRRWPRVPCRLAATVRGWVPPYTTIPSGAETSTKDPSRTTEEGGHQSRTETTNQKPYQPKKSSGEGREEESPGGLCSGLNS